MRHASFDPRCERCFMKPPLCLCSVLVKRPTQTHVRVVVHDVELMKSTNSGRFLPLLLERASLVPYGGGHVPLDVARTTGPDHARAFVLFPQGGVPYVDEVRDQLRAQNAVDPRPTTLIVLDGTWHQANRLRKKFLTAGIPFTRLRDDVRPSTYQLRNGHFGQSLSTLEAAARALAILEGGAEGEAVEAHLVDGFRRMVDRTLWLRGSKEGADVYGGLPDGLTRHGIHQFTTPNDDDDEDKEDDLLTAGG